MLDYRLPRIFSIVGFSISLPLNLYFIYLTVFHVKHVYEQVLRIALVLWAGLYVVVVASIAVQFVYRFLSLLGSDLTKNLKNFENAVWLLYPFLPGVYYAATVYWLGLPDEYSDGYVRAVISENYLFPQSTLPRFIFTPYSSDGSIRWKNLSYLISVCCLVSFHYLVILFCSIKMHLNMKQELEKFSVYNRKLHIQFFKALIFQSLGPTIFIFMPALPVLMSPLIPPSFGLKIDWQTGWLFSMVGLYPPFDSIAFMVIVSEYKEILRDHFLYAFFRNSAKNQIHGSLKTATAVNARICQMN